MQAWIRTTALLALMRRLGCNAPVSEAMSNGRSLPCPLNPKRAIFDDSDDAPASRCESDRVGVIRCLAVVSYFGVRYAIQGES